MLSKVKINRFKNIEEITLNLDQINVLIGTNNSGKSSILQAIQFAVSVAQTSTFDNSRWLRAGRLPTSISPMQLVYSPLRDVYALALNRDLGEDINHAIKIEFEETGTLNTAKIIVKKGRNKNIAIEMIGRELGEKLQSVEEPFSIFVPGLAGIPAFEEYKTPSTVRKAAARGDANNVLRNVLFLLKNETFNWDIFIEDLRSIFPNIELDVDFNPNRDEFINATIKIGEKILPIDAAGTGVLQAIQILSYINIYKPKVLLLDEPDSHLHPNNQRKLINMLTNLAENRGIQIVLSTHSRHIIDELQGNAKMHWVRNGGLVDESDFDELKVLLDLGALDKGDLLFQDTLKCVILTEDENSTPIKPVLEASGFQMDEIDIWAYKGCTNVEPALVLNAFIRKHVSSAAVLLHRDRDYLTDEEAESFRGEIETAGMHCFLTRGTDIESYYLSPNHIHYLYPQVASEWGGVLLSSCIEEKKSESIEKFINIRTQIETVKCRRSGTQPNHGRISRNANEQYLQDPRRYCHGKTVLNFHRSKTQQELGTNINLFRATEFIKDGDLQRIARLLWANDHES
jgi:predicted ATPase